MRFAAFIAAGVLLGACGSEPPRAARPGVFIVGVDGMDPVILSRLMGEGKMPNFAQLARDGSYQTLGTSNPPQSPVAWSSFVTGMDPGGHGIFDFVHRDPKTYHPVSSATSVDEEPPAALRAFGYVVPLWGGEMRNNRGGTPWWDRLVEAGVDVEVYQVPGNFPTPPSKAKVLSGMGTVDLRGGFGTYTFYTDAPVAKANPKGDIQRLSVDDLDLDGIPDTARGILRGPPNQFRLEPGETPGINDYLTTGVTISIDANSDTAAIEVGGNVVVLQEGEWSNWVPVTFDALPLGLSSAEGIVRFYAKQLRPHLQVYASPVNLSPADSPMEIASPGSFLEEVYNGVGYFYTQGLPEETDALADDTFNDDDYLSQVALVLDDTQRLIQFALERFEPGDTTFVYLSDIDLQCHMLWRHGDPKYPQAQPHPAFEPESAAAHQHDIEQFYRGVDEALGKIRDQLPPDTLLIVMSDHGFQPYTRKLHLNAWLRDQGYLVLKDGKTKGHIVQDDVDWSRTKAYGVGFNGLYLNRKGREGQGILSEAEAVAVGKEIAAALTAYRDPENGEQVVLRVDVGAEIYSPARAGEGPDLVVGYNAGYGCSDASTLGEITEVVIEDNTSRWSGNHLMAPEVVPGVLLVNRKLPGEGHQLTDLTATLLQHYGLARPAELQGKSIF